MKTLTYKNYVEYDEIFQFAEKELDIHWNTCCDIFHRTEIFRNKHMHEFYLGEVESDLEGFKTREKATHFDKEKWIKAYEILKAFMEKNKVEFMNVLGGDK